MDNPFARAFFYTNVDYNAANRAYEFFEKISGLLALKSI